MKLILFSFGILCCCAIISNVIGQEDDNESETTTATTTTTTTSPILLTLDLGDEKISESPLPVEEKPKQQQDSSSYIINNNNNNFDTTTSRYSLGSLRNTVQNLMLRERFGNFRAGLSRFRLPRLQTDETSLAYRTGRRIGLILQSAGTRARSFAERLRSRSLTSSPTVSTLNR